MMKDEGRLASSERPYWLAWSRVRGVGPQGVARLRRHFTSLEVAWRADERELRASGLRPAACAEMLRVRGQLHLEREQESLAEKHIHWCTLAEDGYPALLKNIEAPPLVLYWRGQADWPEFALAVVGTRKASRYGLEATKELVTAIGDAGYTIISGLAEGIDTAAHQAALGTRGGTLAVLGNGLEEIYPPRNAKLAERIVEEEGLLVSEFAPSVKPIAQNFPHRNRIISGLSLGVLVMEAPARSGALITAERAAAQSRHVFAIPHSIHAANGAGCNDLLTMPDTFLVRSAEDVLGVLGGQELARSAQRPRAPLALKQEKESAPPETPQSPPVDLSEMERAVLDGLGSESAHIDELVQSSGLPVATVSSLLTLLEIKGQVELVAAMQYRKLSGRG